MIRRTIALLLLATIAGCSKPAPQPPKREVPKPVALVKGGWSKVFASPADTLSALARLGFGMGDYKAIGGVHRAVGTPAFASRSAAPKPNRSNVEVTGSAKQLDAVRFTLALTDPVDAKFAREQFVELLAIRLPQIGVDGAKTVTPAIQQDADVTGTVDGADYAVTHEPLDAGAKRLVVTFSRPGSSPQNSPAKE